MKPVGNVTKLNSVKTRIISYRINFWQFIK